MLSASASVNGGRTENAEVSGGDHPEVFVLESELAEAERIADVVISAMTRSGTSIAVLARTHKLLDPIESTLARRGVNADRRGHGSLMAERGTRDLFRLLREHVRAAGEFTWYDRLLDAADEGDPAARHLLDVLAGFEGAAHTWNIQRLASEVATWDRHRIHANPVVLSTFHGAKGAAYDTVVVCGLDSVGLPFRTEEEERLLYVATTRARRHLVLTAARVRGGKATERHSLLSAIAVSDEPFTHMPVVVTEHGRLRKTPEDERYERLTTWRTTTARATMLPEPGLASDVELTKLAAVDPLTPAQIEIVLGVFRAEQWGGAIIEALR